MPDEAPSTQAHGDDTTISGIVEPWGHAPDEADNADKAGATSGTGSAAGGEPVPGQVHPGWASVPDDAFSLGQSGGWGGPDHTLTGPIPIIRRHDHGDDGDDGDKDSEVDASPDE